MKRVFIGIGLLVMILESAAGAPALILNKCPQAPEELRLGSQGGLYVCRKVGCDGVAAQEPVPVATPAPLTAQLMCDATARLISRVEGRVVSLDEFASQDRCARAAEQFKNYKGCYCGPDFSPKCFVASATGAKFDAVAGSFSRLDACIRALEQFLQSVDVKLR